MSHPSPKLAVISKGKSARSILSEVGNAYNIEAFHGNKRRFDLAMTLPMATLDKAALQEKLQTIGREADKS